MIRGKICRYALKNAVMFNDRYLLEGNDAKTSAENFIDPRFTLALSVTQTLFMRILYGTAANSVMRLGRFMDKELRRNRLQLEVVAICLAGGDKRLSVTVEETLICGSRYGNPQ